MILASQSPRRIELMREAGYDIRVIPADIDETPFDGEAPLTLVERLARAKAAAVAAEHAEPNELTVAADTIVTFDGKILGKPATEDEARTMLRELSGRTHQVATGVCIVKEGDTAAPHAAESLSFVDVTDVTFYELTEEQIERYVASGEPMDKAGAYGIQGTGGRMLVHDISGDFYNVVGLPIARVARAIQNSRNCIWRWLSPSAYNFAVPYGSRPGIRPGGKPIGENMDTLLEAIDVCNVDGFCFGNYTDEEAGTGCTVIVAPEGATGGVDVRGGAPASRETDLLRPENTVDKVHAVCLSGGSAFGLEAASGVARELESRGIGLSVGPTQVPIVCSSCIFDLAFGDPTVRPDIEAGIAAVREALDNTPTTLEQGNVGAGTGATVGKLMGPATCMKAGLGTAAVALGPVKVGAVVSVNACGNVVDPLTGEWVAGMRTSADSDQIVDMELAAFAAAGSMQMPLDRTNTTISCIVTNMELTKAQATKVSQMAADAYAHAIRPTHTTNDGDTIYTLASGKLGAQASAAVPLDLLGMLAVRALQTAIVNGAKTAKTSHGIPGAAK